MPSITEIAKMPHKERHAWFVENARFMPDAPAHSCYTLPWGNRHLHSWDTYELFQAMEKEVRKVRSELRKKGEL